MTRKQLKGTIYPAWEIDNLLSEEECENYIRYIDSFNDRTLQTIIKDGRVAWEIFDKIKEHADKIVEKGKCRYKLIGCSDFITLTKGKNPIGIHKDETDKVRYKGEYRPDLTCFYKVGIYLNNLSTKEDPVAGGTKFYDSHKRYLTSVKPKVGKAFIFNMNEYHSGEKFEKGKIKYLIGIRLLYKHLPHEK